jgi:hypothetical protein
VLREEGLIPPPTPAKNKLDGFHDQIDERIQKRLKVTRILREIRELGYQGGRTILAQYVRQRRPALTVERSKPIKRRFETGPGEEAQIDFSPFSVFIAGVLVVVHIFAVLLCYSRRVFVRYFRKETTSMSSKARERLRVSRRLPKVVLDNMTQAVLGRHRLSARCSGISPSSTSHATMASSIACAVRD